MKTVTKFSKSEVEVREKLIQLERYEDVIKFDKSKRSREKLLGEFPREPKSVNASMEERVLKNIKERVNLLKRAVDSIGNHTVGILERESKKYNDENLIWAVNFLGKEISDTREALSGIVQDWE